MAGSGSRDRGESPASEGLIAAGRSDQRGSNPLIQTATLRQVRRLFDRHYGIPPDDIDDLVGEALVDYVRTGKSGDRLFFVIASRRACDFCRRRRRKPVFETTESLSTAPSLNLETEMFEGMVARFSKARPRLDKPRLLGVVRDIMEGYSFAEACRQNGIPRGSQARCRTTLRECFDSLRPEVCGKNRTSRSRRGASNVSNQA
ncbi:MAG TPA: hypothetical protein VLA89_02000 [Gemmatimonadales bacterium]|nr:hypothetical protein [Gemmatimonadales bacterium]